MKNQKTPQQEWTVKCPKGFKIVGVELSEDGWSLTYYTVQKTNDTPTVKVTTDPYPKMKQSTEEFEKMFRVVDIEGLSLDEDFMTLPLNFLSPRGYEHAQRIRDSIIKAKNMGMRNFRKPSIDPSYDFRKKMIFYKEGERPGVGLSPIKFEEIAKQYDTTRGSEIMTDLEQDVFLGILVKELIEHEKKGIKKSWELVCCNSSPLGHFTDSINSIKDWERTGSRKVGRWSDLGNTCKIVRSHEDPTVFYLYGGYFYNSGRYFPLPEKHEVNIHHAACHWSVGQMKMKE